MDEYDGVQWFDKKEHKMPATIDDPAILDEIKQDLIKNNILK